MQVANLNAHARTPCGFAAVENVAPSKKPLRDHMDSYFLAETLKFQPRSVIVRPLLRRRDGC